MEASSVQFMLCTCPDTTRFSTQGGLVAQWLGHWIPDCEVDSCRVTAKW